MRRDSICWEVFKISKLKVQRKERIQDGHKILISTKLRNDLFLFYYFIGQVDTNLRCGKYYLQRFKASGYIQSSEIKKRRLVLILFFKIAISDLSYLSSQSKIAYYVKLSNSHQQ